MNLNVGQKIQTVNNDFVEIIGIHKDNIIVQYRGKTYIIYKKMINEQLPMLTNNEKQKDNNIKQETEFKKSCKNCMEMKNGNCFGEKNGICEDYRCSPTISKDEIERWPKVGAALDIKFNKRY